jgi:hypothetical protein
MLKTVETPNGTYFEMANFVFACPEGPFRVRKNKNECLKKVPLGYAPVPLVSQPLPLHQANSIMSLAELLTGNRLVRGAADALLARFARRRTLYLDQLDVPAKQERTLLKLVRYAAQTKFGKQHDFAHVRSVADYQTRVPIRAYEAYWKEYWEPGFPNIQGVTWPDWTPYYALSSGTSSGVTKYIPVTRQMLSSNRKAAATSLAFYRSVEPKTALLNGRIFFLGGNTGMRKMADGSLAGDLSAIAAIEVAGLFRPYTYPPLEISAIPELEARLDALARNSINLPITVFSGVPSWQLIIFDRLKRITGKATIAEIWPKLRLVIHGGTGFEPYRELFKKELGSERIRCLEVYPCSEGYVATEDPRYQMLRVIPDHGVFFEFIPMEHFQKGILKNNSPARHTLANVELGVEYAVVMTSCAGVWSYLVGDTVLFERRSPPLIRFTGRTAYFLSAFGEHLIAEEVEKAVAEAARATAAEAVDFHVGPVFSPDPTKPGHHVYLIEFRHSPTDLAQFTQIMDRALARLNEDYETHRIGDLTMKMPEVIQVRTGAFNRWLTSQNKGIQSKVPRMDNTGKLTQKIWQWLRENDSLI